MKSRPTSTSFVACLLILLSIGCHRFTGFADFAGQEASETNSAAAANDGNQIAPGDATNEANNITKLVVPRGLDEQQFIGPLADAYRRIDPKSDGWDTEAFSQAAVSQLKILAKCFVSDADPSSVVSESFQTTELWAPPQLKETYRDDVVAVRRIASPITSLAESAGQQRMKELVTQFRAEFSDHPHIKFKLYRVQANTQAVDTMAYFHAEGGTDGGRKEITANWRITWELNQASQATPRIRSIRVDELEIVDVSNDGKTLFADCTSSIFHGDSAYNSQMLYSTDHWRSRLCRDYGLDVVANHGLVIGDVNNDMLEDLYVCQQGGLPNRLFIQQPDGTLKDESATSGTDWLNYTASALLIDLDNDGDKDLVVGQEQHIVIMSNNGTGVFEIANVLPARAQTFSLAAADFDVDGDLDIFCCGYNNLGAKARTGAMGEPIPYHDAQNGGPNLLLQNQGNWNFVDVTKQVGLEQNNNRFAFAASWEDYDNDGDPDLYVANDYGRNNLYRNDRGQFTDVAKALNVEDMSSGMSVSWADFNRDGWMDFYVSNMFSAAGNRITYQRQFKDSTSGEIKKIFQRHARGNSLFQGDGRGGFNDVSVDAGVTMGRWAWGSKFCDINNDGWQDILVNNGFISSEDTGDL